MSKEGKGKTMVPPFRPTLTEQQKRSLQRRGELASSGLPLGGEAQNALISEESPTLSEEEYGILYSTLLRIVRTRARSVLAYENSLPDSVWKRCVAYPNTYIPGFYIDKYIHDTLSGRWGHGERIVNKRREILDLLIDWTRLFNFMSLDLDGRGRNAIRKRGILESQILGPAFLVRMQEIEESVRESFPFLSSGERNNIELIFNWRDRGRLPLGWGGPGTEPWSQIFQEVEALMLGGDQALAFPSDRDFLEMGRVLDEELSSSNGKARERAILDRLQVFYASSVLWIIEIHHAPPIPGFDIKPLEDISFETRHPFLIRFIFSLYVFSLMRQIYAEVQKKAPRSFYLCSSYLRMAQERTIQFWWALLVEDFDHLFAPVLDRMAGGRTGSGIKAVESFLNLSLRPEYQR